jgi:hypothetical protein
MKNTEPNKQSSARPVQKRDMNKQQNEKNKQHSFLSYSLCLQIPAWLKLPNRVHNNDTTGTNDGRRQPKTADTIRRSKTIEVNTKPAEKT